MYIKTGLLALTTSGPTRLLSFYFDNPWKTSNVALDKILCNYAWTKVGLHPERLAIILNHAHGHIADAMLRSISTPKGPYNISTLSLFHCVSSKPSANSKDLLDTYELQGMQKYQQLNERILQLPLSWLKWRIGSDEVLLTKTVNK
jgi:hypothetical protein